MYIESHIISLTPNAVLIIKISNKHTQNKILFHRVPPLTGGHIFTRAYNLLFYSLYIFCMNPETYCSSTYIITGKYI